MPLDSSHGAERETAAFVTFQEERLTDLREEGADLFAQHWLESSTDLSVRLDLNWAAYAAMEAAGMMLTVTLRCDSKLAGYAIYITGSPLHYRTRTVGESDAYFIDNATRARWANRLFAEAERRLAARGMDEAWARVKFHVKRGRKNRDLQRFFERRGYVASEVLMRKRLR